MWPGSWAWVYRETTEDSGQSRSWNVNLWFSSPNRLVALPPSIGFSFFVVHTHWVRFWANTTTFYFYLNSCHAMYKFSPEAKVLSKYMADKFIRGSSITLSCFMLQKPGEASAVWASLLTLPFLLPYLTLLDLTLPYLTYLTLPYLTWPDLTLPYPTLPYLTLPYLTWPDLTLTLTLTLPYLTLPYLTWPDLTLGTLPYLTLPCLSVYPTRWLRENFSLNIFSRLQMLTISLRERFKLPGFVFGL